jgi:NADPH:quinone reductase-like Zn-dependent oxidoreductase
VAYKCKENAVRAVVVERYGPPEVAAVQSVADPAPRAGEVLVRVRAAAVTSGDARIRGGRFPSGFAFPARLALGLRGPRRRILGGTFAGVVETVGPSVKDVGPGDEVAGMSGARMGAHAELLTVPAAKLAHIPAGVSHADAAGVLFGGTTALCYLRDKISLRPGSSILVVGAAGAVGTNAVQLARHLGATVTGVTSAANVELVRRLGAHHVLDRGLVDLADVPDHYDVVLDTVGALTRSSGRRLLAPGGVLGLVAAGLGDTIRARGDVVAGPSSERAADFAELLAMVAAGELTVVHDAQFSLEDIAQAYHRVDSGHKVGNVLVLP